MVGGDGAPSNGSGAPLLNQLMEGEAQRGALLEKAFAPSDAGSEAGSRCGTVEPIKHLCSSDSAPTGNPVAARKCGSDLYWQKHHCSAGVCRLATETTAIHLQCR